MMCIMGIKGHSIWGVFTEQNSNENVFFKIGSDKSHNCSELEYPFKS